MMNSIIISDTNKCPFVCNEGKINVYLYPIVISEYI